MTDLEVIEEFKQHISWGDETTIIEFELLSGQKKKAMLSSAMAQIPIHWEDFRVMCLESHLWLDCQSKGVVLGFIVWGNPDRDEVESIFLTRINLPLSTSITYLDVKAKVWDNHLTIKALDGIDWRQTFEKVAKDGVNASPVWQWDQPE